LEEKGFWEKIMIGIEEIKLKKEPTVLDYDFLYDKRQFKHIY
jgi:hypothetical protein